MPIFYMSLLSEAVAQNQSVDAPALFGALWAIDGRVVVNDEAIAAGKAALLQGRSQISGVNGSAQWLRFALTEAPLDAPGLLHSEKVTLETALVLLRLDTVTFPPGVSAWRHVHPGPGIRHLLQGELVLHADDHSRILQAGETWFEPAEAPVRAVASDAEPKTSFVRFMALPTRYLGVPTIRILDPEDAAKPRLQVTHRHVDHIVRLPQG